MKLKMLAACAMFAGSATAARAAPTVFDFESIAYGTYVTAAQTVGGLTVTMTGSATSFDVVNAPPGGDFGTRSVLSYFDRGGSPIIANFSSTVADITLFGTDYTPSDTDQVYFQAFSGVDGTGTLLGTATSATCCETASFPAGVASLNASGIRSIVFWEAPGDSFQGALYFDNLTIGSFGGVPEPQSWALMVLGFGAVGAMLRRRQRVSVRYA